MRYLSASAFRIASRAAMGEAKRRGHRDQRVAQAIERKKIEAAASHEKYLAHEAERRENEARRRTALETRDAMFARERPVVIVGGGNSLHARLLLASLSGLLA